MKQRLGALGLNGTPRSASGISARMISALKISADRIALAGVASPITLSALQAGQRHDEHRGNDGKIFGNVVGDGKCGQGAPRDQHLLADLDDVDELGRDRSRGRPCLPASLAALVPECMATPTSAWASAGASLVPSPVIATSRPCALFAADELELFFRLRLGHEIVHACLRRRWRRRSAGCLLSPSPCECPSRAIARMRSRMPDLTTSDSSMTPRIVRLDRDGQRRRAFRDTCSTVGRRSAWLLPPNLSAHVRRPH